MIGLVCQFAGEKLAFRTITQARDVSRTCEPSRLKPTSLSPEHDIYRSILQLDSRRLVRVFLELDYVSIKLTQLRGIYSSFLCSVMDSDRAGFFITLVI